MRDGGDDSPSAEVVGADEGSRGGGGGGGRGCGSGREEQQEEQQELCDAAEMWNGHETM